VIGASRRPRSLSVHGRHWHLFLFRWGITLRCRRHGDWRHVSVNMRRSEWRHFPGRHSTAFQIETWKTVAGTTDRKLGSKRYIRLKVSI
jgi:hypothetical protein